MIIKIFKLLADPNNENITDALQTLYLQKVGLLLFAKFATRLDIAFIVSGLLQFN